MKTLLAAQPLRETITKKDFIYYLTGTIVYILALAPVSFFFGFLPVYDTDSIAYRELFYTVNVYTEYFSVAKWLYYPFIFTAGFTFVNIVSLKNRTNNPFISGNGDYKALFITIGSAMTWLFFLAGNEVLRGKYDLNGYCPQNSFRTVESTYQEVNAEELSTAQRLMYEFEMPENHAECKTYTQLNAWSRYNFLFYTIAYVIGCNFTHLDKIPIFRNFTLTCDDMKNWTKQQWIIFAALIIFIGVNVVYLFYLYHLAKIMKFYILLLIATVLFFVGGTYYYRKTKNLHVHHYVVGCLVVMFSGYQTGYISFLNGLFAAIMTEGACHYGYSHIWTPKNEGRKPVV